MTTTRTDIHSPANFDPADYTYVGSFDAWRDYAIFGAQSEEEEHLRHLLNDRGFPGGNWQEKGQCDHCGARFRYVTVWQHTPTGQHIAVGETCATERFDLPDRVAFDVKRLREKAAAERERARVREEAEAFLDDQEADVRTLLDNDEHDDTPGRDHYIVSDIRQKLHRFGSLSDKQVALVAKIGREQAERQERQAAQRTEVNVPAPEGRVTFQGQVVSTKWKDSDYGTYKVLIIKVTEAEGVWLAYVTEPSSIDADRGDFVRLTATLKRGRDEHFTFGKRPAKAEIIESLTTDAPSALD